MSVVGKSFEPRLGVVAATLAVGVVVASAFTANARTSDSSIKAEELIPEFAAEQTEVDMLPAELKTLAEEGPIELDSVRFIASSDYGDHWVAQSSRDEICLMTMLANESVWSIDCQRLDLFYKHGNSHALGSADSPGVEVHLIPAGVSGSSLRDAVRDSAARHATVESDEAKDDGSREIDFQLLGAARLLVLGVDEGEKIGNVRVPRQGDREAVVIYDMG